MHFDAAFLSPFAYGPCLWLVQEPCEPQFEVELVEQENLLQSSKMNVLSIHVLNPGEVAEREVLWAIG